MSPGSCKSDFKEKGQCPQQDMSTSVSFQKLLPHGGKESKEALTKPDALDYTPSHTRHPHVSASSHRWKRGVGSLGPPLPSKWRVFQLLVQSLYSLVCFSLQPSCSQASRPFPHPPPPPQPCFTPLTHERRHMGIIPLGLLYILFG